MHFPTRFILINALFLFLNWDARADLVNLLNPFAWLDEIGKLALPPTARDDPSINNQKQIKVPSKPMTSLEETIFLLGPKIQSYYEPSDVEAKENYIMSPLGAGVIIAHLLIGTHNEQHDFLANMMKLTSEKPRREVHIMELTKDPLYDNKLYHSAFHWKLQVLLGGIEVDKEDYRFQLRTGLFYQRETELVSHFKDYLQQFYHTDIEPIKGFQFSSESEPQINEWNQKLIKDAPNNWTSFIFEHSQAALLNELAFTSFWEQPFDKELKWGKFTVKPYEAVSIHYLTGQLKNVQYIENLDFKLLAIPHREPNISTIIIQPHQADYMAYQIRQFSEGLNYNQVVEALREAPVEDIELQLPNIFSNLTLQLNFLKPLLNYLNDEKSLLAGGDTEEFIDVKMNGAAKTLSVNHILQQFQIALDPPEIQCEDLPLKNESSTESPETPTASFTSRYFGKKKRSAPLRKVEINRPFVFLILHRKSNTVLFWGSISKPQLLAN